MTIRGRSETYRAFLPDGAGSSGALPSGDIAGRSETFRAIVPQTDEGPEPLPSGLIVGRSMTYRIPGLAATDLYIREITGYPWSGGPWHETAAFALGPELYPEGLGHLVSDVDDASTVLDFGDWTTGDWPGQATEDYWRSTLWHMPDEYVEYLSETADPIRAEVTRGLTRAPVAHLAGTAVQAGDNATCGSIVDGGTTFTTSRGGTFTVHWTAYLKDDGAHFLIEPMQFELRLNGAAVATVDPGPWTGGEIYYVAADETMADVVLVPGDVLSVWASGTPDETVRIETDRVSIRVTQQA